MTEPKPVLKERDKQLLKELNLIDCKSTEDCHRVISKMTMRPLDKTKMMLKRLDKNGDVFAHDLKERIAKNDLHAFSEAVHSLLQS